MFKSNDPKNAATDLKNRELEKQEQEMLRQELNDSNVYFLKNLRAQFEKEERLSDGLNPVDQDILDSAV